MELAEENGSIQDISAPLGPELVTWPGVGESFERTETASFAAGDGMAVSHLGLGSHTGTHIDAPCHFIPGADGIEAVSLEALVGPAFVVEIPADRAVITDAVLEAAGIPAGTRRLLAKTRSSGWSRGARPFDETYVAFDETAAAWCLRRGIVLVGIDYLSIEPYDAANRDYPVHKALLGAGVVVLESLDLAGVAEGEHGLAVLPLLIPGADGAPARAVLSRPR